MQTETNEKWSAMRREVARRNEEWARVKEELAAVAGPRPVAVDVVEQLRELDRACDVSAPRSSTTKIHNAVVRV